MIISPALSGATSCSQLPQSLPFHLRPVEHAQLDLESEDSNALGIVELIFYTTPCMRRSEEVRGNLMPGYFWFNCKRVREGKGILLYFYI